MRFIVPGQEDYLLRPPLFVLEALEPRRVLNAVAMDPTFNSAKPLSLKVADPFLYSPLAVLPEPDGSTLVAGGANTGWGNPFVLRLTPSGALDTTFASGGIFDQDLGIENFQSAVLEPNGDIIIVGYGGLARLEPNGQIDTAFGDHGKVFARGVFSVVIQKNGDILALTDPDGYPDDYAGIIRLTPDGQYVSDNSSGASAFNQAIDGSPIVPWATARQHDDRLVVIQESDDASGFSLARYNSSGTLDPAFGNGQRIMIPGWDVLSLTIGPDDSIYVAVETTAANGHDVGRIYHLTPSGQFDMTFGINARANAPTLLSNALVVSDDGSIFTANAAPFGITIQRYNADGSLDSSFTSTIRTRTSQNLSARAALALQETQLTLAFSQAVNFQSQVTTARFVVGSDSGASSSAEVPPPSLYSFPITQGQTYLLSAIPTSPLDLYLLDSAKNPILYSQFTPNGYNPGLSFTAPRDSAYYLLAYPSDSNPFNLTVSSGSASIPLTPQPFPYDNTSSVSPLYASRSSQVDASWPKHDADLFDSDNPYPLDTPFKDPIQ